MSERERAAFIVAIGSVVAGTIVALAIVGGVVFSLENVRYSGL